MDSIKLGIIELGYRRNDAVSIVEEIIEYAVEAEKLGYSRFWLAEHYYYIENHSYTNSDILIALIAGMTEKIRVGSAGSSIAAYPPYSVVTNFKLLNNLFHGRIDLGLSKGIPESPIVAQLLNKELTIKNSSSIFNNNLEEIIDLLDNEEENLKNKSILIPPYGGKRPDLYYLSISLKNLPQAFKYQTNYCISIFHNFNQDVENLGFEKEKITEFKNMFLKRYNYLPKVSLSLAIVLKDTLEEAEDELKKIMARVKKIGFSERETFIIIPTTLDLLYKRLIDYQYKFGINEFIINDLSSDISKDKIKNLKLLSQKFELS